MALTKGALNETFCTSWPPGGAVWQLHTWNPLVLWVTGIWIEGRRFWAAQSRKINFFGQKLKPFESPDTLTYVIDHIKSDQKVYLLEHWINLLQIALDSKAFKLLFVNSFRRLDKGTKGTRAHLRRLVWKTILHNIWMYGEYLQKTMFITFIFTLMQICICLFVFFSHVVFTKYCCKLSQLIWINLNPHINTFALPKCLDISVHPYESGGIICILWY